MKGLGLRDTKTFDDHFKITTDSNLTLRYHYVTNYSNLFFQSIFNTQKQCIGNGLA